MGRFLKTLSKGLLALGLILAVNTAAIACHTTNYFFGGLMDNGDGTHDITVIIELGTGGFDDHCGVEFEVLGIPGTNITSYVIDNGVADDPAGFGTDSLGNAPTGSATYTSGLGTSTLTFGSPVCGATFVSIADPQTQYFYKIVLTIDGDPAGGSLEARGLENNNCNETQAFPVCNIGTSTAAAGTCNPNTNSYPLTVTMNYNNPPASGTLDIDVGLDGTIDTTLSAPFHATTINFTTNITYSCGASGRVVLAFSDNSGCMDTATFTPPNPMDCYQPCQVFACNTESAVLVGPALGGSTDPNYSSTYFLTDLSGAILTQDVNYTFDATTLTPDSSYLVYHVNYENADAAGVLGASNIATLQSSSSLCVDVACVPCTLTIHPEVVPPVTRDALICEGDVIDMNDFESRALYAFCDTGGSAGGTTTTNTTGTGAVAPGTFISTTGGINYPENINVTGADASATFDAATCDISFAFDITHTFDADIELTLVAPGGQSAILFTDVGGAANDFTNTVINNNGSPDISGGSAPFTGIFAPEGGDGVWAGLNGTPLNGVWTANVFDDANGDGGTINSIAISVTCPVTTTLPASGTPQVTSWWDASTGGTQLANDTSHYMPPFYFAMSSGSYTYFTQCEDTATGCISARTPVTLGISAPPPAPSVNDYTICEGDSAPHVFPLPSQLGNVFLLYNDNMLTDTVGGGAKVSFDFGDPAIATGGNFDRNVAGIYEYYMVELDSVGTLQCVSAPTLFRITVIAAPPMPAPTNSGPVCEGDSYQLFTGAVPGATYEWYDDALLTNLVSNTQNPIFTNATAGTITYYNRVCVSGCCSDTGMTMVTVNARPVATLPTTITVCSDTGDVTFPDPASGGTAPYTYSWTGVGGFTSSSATPTIPNATTADEGTYTVIVTDANGCISASASVTLDVNTTPGAIVLSSNGPVCEGDRLEITATAFGDPGVTYTWTGPGVPVGHNSPNLVIDPAVVADGGAYTVSVTFPAASDCTPSTDALTVVVNATPIDPNPVAGPPACAGGDLMLFAAGNAADNYAWSGSNSWSSTMQNPTITNVDDTWNGTYSVTVTSSAGCSATGSVNVNTINPTPSTPNIISNSPLCEGDDLILNSDAYSGASVTYTWTFPDGSNTTSSVPYLVVNGVAIANDGFYSVTVNVDGCQSDTSAPTMVQVTATPATPVIVDNGPNYCEGDVITLSTAAIADDYNWSGPSGFNSSLQNPPSINPALPSNSGNYTLIVSNNGCESAAASVTLTVAPRPNAPHIETEPSICFGDSIKLTTSGACASYLWIGPDGASVSTLANPLLTTATNTTCIPPGDVAYDAGDWGAICVDANGCRSFEGANINVSITPIPNTPSANNSGPVCQGNDVTLIGSGDVGVNYNWFDTIPDGIVKPIAQSMTYNVGVLPAGTYTYYLQLESNDCVSGVDSTIVTIYENPDVTTMDIDLNCVYDTTDLNLMAMVLGGTMPYTYAWNSPNSFFSTLASPTIPNVDANDAGTYVVLVTDSNGCQATEQSIQVDISIIPDKPIITSNSPVCEPSTLTLATQMYSGGSVVYNWTGAGATVSSNEIDIFPSSFAVHNGEQYSVQVTVDGCSSEWADTLNAVVNEKPVIDVPDVTLACVDDTTDLTLTSTVTGGVPPFVFSWTGPGGFTSSSQNPVIPNVDASNSGTYTVVVTDSNGCTSDPNSAIVDITIRPDQPTLSSTDPVCEPDGFTLSTQLYSGGTVVYNWTGVDAAGATGNIVNIAPSSFAAHDGQVYTVQVTVDGCASYVSDPHTVTVNEKPVIMASDVTMPCVDDTTTLQLTSTVTGGDAPYTFFWNGPASFTSTQQNPTRPNTDMTHSGTYVVQVTDSNGCVSDPISAVVNITERPAQPVVTANDPVCEPDPVTLSTGTYSGATVSYAWTGAGAMGSTSNTVTINPTSSATHDGTAYTVTVTVDGCASDASAPYVLTVNEKPVIMAPDVTLTCVDDTTTLNLTSTVTGGDAPFTFSWTGPGGFTSSDQNPTIPNANATHNGTYTVVVTDSNGCVSDANSAVVSVTVKPAQPVLSANDPVCEPNPVTLNTGTYSGATVSYAWTGAGAMGSTSNTVTINPTSSATHDGTAYTVTVTVDGCASDASAPYVLTVNEKPVINAPDVTLTCVDDTTTLNLTSTVTGGDAPFTFSWTGPGGFTSSDQNPTIPNANATHNGTYTVVVTDSNGCVSNANSAVVSVTVRPAQPVVTANDPVCEPNSVTINTAIYSGATVSYTWTGPGAVGITSNTFTISPTSTAMHDGNAYTVAVTVDGCVSDVSAPYVLTVNEKPVVFAPDTTVSCADGTDTLFLQSIVSAGDAPFTYSWTGPGGYTSSDANPFIPNANSSDAGSYTVVVSDSNGCVSDASTAIVDVTDRPLTPSISSAGPLCEGDILTLNTTAYTGSVVNYNWNTPTGIVTTTVPSLVITGVTTLDDGLYSVEVDVDGCISLISATTYVVVNPTPMPPVISTNGPVYCENDTIIIWSTTKADGYTWSGPNAYSSTNQYPPTIAPALPLHSGIYQLYVTDNGCVSDTASVNVTVNPQPHTPTIASNSPICNGDTLMLTTSGACASYEWIGPDGASASTLTNPLLSTTTNTTWIPQGDSAYDSGLWGVICVDANGCKSDLSSQIQVTINPIPVPPTALNNGPICDGDNVTLTGGISLPGAIYSWYVDGSSVPFSTNRIETVFGLTSTTTYKLIVTVNGCHSDTTSTTVVVNSIPVAPIPTYNIMCEFDTLFLSTNPVGAASTYNSITWAGPSGFMSMDENPFIGNASSTVHAGSYSVTIDSNGCTSSGVVEVIINPLPATPTLTNNTAICEGDLLELNTDLYTGLGVTYNWTHPDLSTSNTTVPQLIISPSAMADSGNYTVTVTVDGCTSHSSPISVAEINRIPAAPAMSSNSPVCEGETIQLSTTTVADAYIWTGPNGYASSDRDPSVITNATAADAGTYYLSVIINGCESPQSSVVVVVNPTPATPVILSNSPVCEGDRLILWTETSNTFTHIWTLPNLTTVTTTDSFLIIDPAVLGDGGDYTVRVEANGCISDPAVPITIVVNHVPLDNSFAGPDLIICDGTNNIQLAADLSAGGGVWTTNSSAVIVTPTSGSSIITNMFPGNSYEFYWTISNGACVNYSTDTMVITMAKDPVALLDSFQMLENNIAEFLDLVDNDTSFNGLSTFIQLAERPENGTVVINDDTTVNYTPNPDFYGLDSFYYTICLKQCPDMCAQTKVIIRVDADLFIPNIITPNNDGVNDGFVIDELANYPDHRLEIFNRWGDKVFEAEPYNNDWVGTWDFNGNGNDLPDGTYYYVLTNTSNGQLIRNGFIQIFK